VKIEINALLSTINAEKSFFIAKYGLKRVCGRVDILDNGVLLSLYWHLTPNTGFI